MEPALWRSFGASVIGPAHVSKGMLNQDAWHNFHHHWGDGIVVSDGLGSKPLSNIGSRWACVAVERAAREVSATALGGSPAELPDRIVQYWLESIAPLEPKDAAATCLFAVRSGDGSFHLGMLGDGCAAALRTDGSVTVLTDDKTASFSNMTAALGPQSEAKEWTLLDIDESECDAIVLCTDGVSDDLEDIEGFMTGLVRSFAGVAPLVAARRTREMLESWPVPKHSDDKTIACLLRAEDADA